VQDALNKIDIADGGPDPLLVVDGFIGPKTVGAIDRFQNIQFPQKFPDGRMDPGQRTVTRLNELLSTGSQVGSGLLTNVSSFAPGGNGVKSKANLVPIPVAQTFPEPKTNAERLDLAEKLAIDAERRITAGVNRMNKALKALAKTKRTADEQQLVREIDWHFKASADTNPTSHMAKVSTVLAIMLTAVREQNLGTRSIFKAGTHPDPTAIAAAEPGGFSSLKQEDRFIIITPIFRTQSSAVIVHELGHFCGGSRASGKDVVHRATPKPFPTGTKREDGNTNYKDMPPFHARTNVFSYLIYCFPELPEFKVP
jgi:peptidoglycan hydrolase-like protein with peptidoglycan-binding domain